MVLNKAKDIAEYLKIDRKAVTKIAQYLPIFGVGENRFKYVTTKAYLDFIQNRIKSVTNGEFSTIKELMSTSQYHILGNPLFYKKKSENPITIAFNNLKGGVTKTTTVANVAAIAASFNQRVLLVDMDMQNQLSDHFTNEVYKNRSILQIIQDYDQNRVINKELILKTIQKVSVGNNKTVDLLPSEWALGRGLESARSITNISTLLKKIVEQVKDDYDFIFIDTPPTNISALELSFFASDYITFVTNAERKSYQSFEYLVEEMHKLQRDAKESNNLIINLDSIILGKYNKTAVSTEWLELIEEIASYFFPDSKYPMLELNVHELMDLNHYITNRISDILDKPVLKNTMNLQMTQIMSMFDKKRAIQENKVYRAAKKYKVGKLVKYGGAALNIVNPVYWFRKLVINTSVDAMTKKVCVVIIGIVGEETTKVYSKKLFEKPVELDMIETEINTMLEEGIIDEDEPDE